MRKVEVAFLVCVFGLAGIFASMSISQAVSRLPGGSRAEAYATGSAGKPRDVDMGALEQMLRGQYLSDHEAQFYKPVPAVPQFPQATSDEPSGDEDF